MYYFSRMCESLCAFSFRVCIYVSSLVHSFILGLILLHLPPTNSMLRLIGHSKSRVGVDVSVNGCLSSRLNPDVVLTARNGFSTTTTCNWSRQNFWTDSECQEIDLQNRQSQTVDGASQCHNAFIHERIYQPFSTKISRVNVWHWQHTLMSAQVFTWDEYWRQICSLVVALQKKLVTSHQRNNWVHIGGGGTEWLRAVGHTVRSVVLSWSWSSCPGNVQG